MEYRKYVGNQKFDMKVKNAKYTYCDKAYHLGPFIDFLAELEVENTGYDSIVTAIKNEYLDCEDVQLMTFSK